MTTPARRQYLRIKSQYPDAILMYQVGDFYETFDEDARIAARELQIVLTSRKDGEDGRVPLAGVPLHALENYVGKLVQRGLQVLRVLIERRHCRFFERPAGARHGIHGKMRP